MSTFRHKVEMGFGTEEIALTLNIEGEFEGPDRLTCRSVASLAGLTIPVEELTIVGSQVWLNSGDGWKSVTASDPEVVDLLDICAGSPTFWQDYEQYASDFEHVTEQTEEINGVLAVRRDVGGLLDELGSLGFAFAALENLDVERYVIWFAEDGGWPVALKFGFTGDAGAFDFSEFGLEEGEVLTIELTADIIDINRPNILVDSPVP